MVVAQCIQSTVPDLSLRPPLELDRDEDDPPRLFVPVDPDWEVAVLADPEGRPYAPCCA